MESGPSVTLDPYDEDFKKLEISAGDSDNLITVTLSNEDHTLGNSLRWILMKNPEVDFCGYSVPHPSEPKMNVRIQTKDGKPSVEALRKGLNDLVSIAEYTLGTFQSEFQMFVDSNDITEDGSEASEMEE
ncbi:RNA polymerase Rpb3/Rpb11 dimerization domain containing protein [Acanthamoeba castellanii str. Neff]|uniref:DNA-directed RNA polymerases I and III subunit RPAC2 n=1 Tax=Acanthamoeba castellanii (strain ATCC 30010 / Neff) TaxID=1257118 RepID=L8GXA1_ACACF|nr:RNA polymerase Rpb3/Rpb11 dimerization domain containing protein [Acanthamoeba castellanii str. Neff]ELR16706.1 RNA polymerase Rpb3/Rpb11 dimerization domain containing protein [Acanthamoeba castellanii str. Neff]